MAEVRWSVELDGEDVDLVALSNVTKEWRTALEEVERGLMNADPRVVWRIEEQAIVRGVASPNGVSETTLRDIVQRTREGFERVERRTGDRIDWPPGINMRAREAIIGVFQQLAGIDSVTIDTGEEQPLVLDRSNYVEPRTAFGRPHQEFSSIDGRLDLISVRSRPEFVIQEHGSNHRVRCRFTDEWIEQVKAALSRRVVVEGLVRYNWKGEPTSVTNITGLFVRPEPALSLEELVGSAPDFTGGKDPVEYIRAMRDEDA